AKTATVGSKTNGDRTPPTDGVSKESRTLSAEENELSQLREELNAGHMAIDAQREKIAELEAQLRILRTASSTTESGTTAGNAAVPVCSQPVMSTSVPSPHQSGGSAERQNQSPLSFKLGSGQFTPGGWADLTGIFRSTDIGSGTGTNFASIPF